MASFTKDSIEINNKDAYLAHSISVDGALARMKSSMEVHGYDVIGLKAPKNPIKWVVPANDKSGYALKEIIDEFVDHFDISISDISISDIMVGFDLNTGNALISLIHDVYIPIIE